MKMIETPVYFVLKHKKDCIMKTDAGKYYYFHSCSDAGSREKMLEEIELFFKNNENIVIPEKIKIINQSYVKNAPWFIEKLMEKLRKEREERNKKDDDNNNDDKDNKETGDNVKENSKTITKKTIEKAINENENTIIIASTGSGKTYSSIMSLQNYRKTLIIVPTVNLRDNIKANYPESNITTDSFKWRKNGGILVACPETAVKWKFIIKEAERIIFDEIHQCPKNKTYRKAYNQIFSLIKKYNKTIIGLTATDVQFDEIKEYNRIDIRNKKEEEFSVEIITTNAPMMKIKELVSDYKNTDATTLIYANNKKYIDIIDIDCVITRETVKQRNMDIIMNGVQLAHILKENKLKDYYLCGKVLFATETFTAGVSIDGKIKKLNIIVEYNETISIADVVQIAARFRNIDEKEIQITLVVPEKEQKHYLSTFTALNPNLNTEEFKKIKEMEDKDKLKTFMKYYPQIKKFSTKYQKYNKKEIEAFFENIKEANPVLQKIRDIQRVINVVENLNDINLEYIPKIDPTEIFYFLAAIEDELKPIEALFQFLIEKMSKLEKEEVAKRLYDLADILFGKQKNKHFSYLKLSKKGNKYEYETCIMEKENAESIISQMVMRETEVIENMPKYERENTYHYILAIFFPELEKLVFKTQYAVRKYSHFENYNLEEDIEEKKKAMVVEEEIKEEIKEENENNEDNENENNEEEIEREIQMKKEIEKELWKIKKMKRELRKELEEIRKLKKELQKEIEKIKKERS